MRSALLAFLAAAVSPHAFAATADQWRGRSIYQYLLQPLFAPPFHVSHPYSPGSLLTATLFQRPRPTSLVIQTNGHGAVEPGIREMPRPNQALSRPNTPP